MNEFVTFRLDGHTAKRLEVIAANERRSRSALIREAVRRQFRIDPPPPPDYVTLWYGEKPRADHG